MEKETRLTLVLVMEPHNQSNMCYVMLNGDKWRAPLLVRECITNKREMCHDRGSEYQEELTVTHPTRSWL